MSLVRVANTADVLPGEIKEVAANGVKLLLANVEGVFHAASKKCPHLGFNLCRGRLDGGAIVCPLHKAKFDLVSGKVVREPKLLFLQMKVKNELTIYQINVADGAVFVEI